MRWTRKTIIAEIKRLHEAGEQLNYSAAEANHLNLVRASAWHFGTWRVAIEAAGIEYESLSRYQRWSKKRIVERIQELHKQKQDLSWRAVSMQLDPPLAAAALRPNGFNSWREAVAAAGIDVENVTRYKYWDHEKVLKAIKARKRRGEPMSSKSLQVTDQSLFCAARRRYGSWDGALDAAGFKSEDIRLRRHNPGLNAPRGKNRDAEPAAPPNGKATKPITITAPVKPAAPAKPASQAKAAAKKGVAASAVKPAAKSAKAPAKPTKAPAPTAAKSAAKTPAKAAGKLPTKPAAKANAAKANVSKAPARKAAKTAAKPAAKSAVMTKLKSAPKTATKKASKADSKSASKTASKAAAPKRRSR